MGYTLYVVSYEQSSDGQWIIEMAMDKKSGTYRNIVIVTTTEEPQLILDSEVKLYVRCTGSYTGEDSTGASHAYPSFELLFWE